MIRENINVTGGIDNSLPDNKFAQSFLKLFRNASLAVAITINPLVSTDIANASSKTKTESILKGVDSVDCTNDRTPLYGIDKQRNITKTRFELPTFVFKDIKDVLSSKRNKGMLKGVGTLLYDAFLAIGDIVEDANKLKDIVTNTPDVFKDSGIQFNILLPGVSLNEVAGKFGNSGRYALRSSNGGHEASNTGLYAPHSCTMSWNRNDLLGWTKDTLGLDSDGRVQIEGAIVPIDIGFVTRPGKKDFVTGAKFVMKKGFDTKRVFLYITINGVKQPLVYQMAVGYNKSKSAAVMKPRPGQQFGED
jgi:hypothetical protein